MLQANGTKIYLCVTINCVNFLLIQICDYDGNILARVNCPTTRPYCSFNHGQCISTPPKECSPFVNTDVAKKSDLCPFSGFFPHPLHCNRFHYCTSELLAIPYVCPYYYIYDPVSHLCRLYRNSQDCPMLDCYRFPNQFVSYKLDRSLYVFCNVDMHGNLRLLLYQCSSETVFNAEKQGCEFGCVDGEGRFEYPGDQTKYYLCLMTNYGEIVPFVMSCNEGSRFESGKCKIEEHNQTVTTEPSTSNTLQHAIAFVPITIPMMKNNSNT